MQPHTAQRLATRTPQLTGRTFGRLFVLERSEKDVKNRAWFWRCVCLCRCDAVLTDLLIAYTRFVTPEAQQAQHRAILAYITTQRIATCQVRTADLTAYGKQQSCGCLAQEHRRTHQWKRRSTRLPRR